jgi:hypothetical protein
MKLAFCVFVGLLSLTLAQNLERDSSGLYHYHTSNYSYGNVYGYNSSVVNYSGYLANRTYPAFNNYRSNFSAPSFSFNYSNLKDKVSDWHDSFNRNKFTSFHDSHNHHSGRGSLVVILVVIISKVLLFTALVIIIVKSCKNCRERRRQQRYNQMRTATTQSDSQNTSTVLPVSFQMQQYPSQPGSQGQLYPQLPAAGSYVVGVPVPNHIVQQYVANRPNPQAPSQLQQNIPVNAYNQYPQAVPSVHIPPVQGYPQHYPPQMMNQHPANYPQIHPQHQGPNAYLQIGQNPPSYQYPKLNE